MFSFYLFFPFILSSITFLGFFWLLFNLSFLVVFITFKILTWQQSLVNTIILLNITRTIECLTLLSFTISLPNILIFYSLNPCKFILMIIILCAINPSVKSISLLHMFFICYPILDFGTLHLPVCSLIVFSAEVSESCPLLDFAWNAVFPSWLMFSYALDLVEIYVPSVP